MNPDVRSALSTEWEQARALRLEMLSDAPRSFSDRLDDVSRWPDERWQVRLSSALMDDSLLVVAVQDGQWVGQMAAREYLSHEPPRVWLLEVYVSPGQRSTGLSGRLLAEVESWTLDRGHGALHLDVHEDSEPARRFYRSMGFTETGKTQPHPLDGTRLELEMVKPLRG